MPALLLAAIGNGSTSEAIDDLISAHKGNAVRSWHHATIASFASASSAIECAVAIQSRVATRNRTGTGDRPVSLRLCVDQIDAGTQSDAGDDAALRRASSIGATMDGGRVLVSRPAYLRARNTRRFAFIPLGQASLDGSAEPVDVFEAISVADRAWTAQTPAPVLSGDLDVVADATAERAIVGSSMVTWARIAIAAGVLMVANRVVWALVSPLQVLTVVFYMAGTFVFGSGGSESAAALGGLLLPLAVPLAAVIHFSRAQRPVAARASIFWLGQSFMSVGESVITIAAPDSFAAAQRDAFVDSLGAIGAAGHAPGLAQLAVAAGCLLIALAVISLIEGGRQRDQGRLERRCDTRAT
jgi:hypothetical protein